MPKKQTWLNPPTTVTSLQSKGWGEGGNLKKQLEQYMQLCFFLKTGYVNTLKVADNEVGEL